MPLGKVMDKKAHADYAFHYACWGAGVTVCTEADETKNENGFSVCQDDGLEHDLAENAYYTNSVTIPDVISDGLYVLGWAWYGGVHGGGATVVNIDTAPVLRASSVSTGRVLGLRSRAARHWRESTLQCSSMV